MAVETRAASEAGNADFASVLSEAIARQQLTLERLQARLRAAGTPVSAATLSYWQTGRSVPTRTRSRRALEELERILALPAGHLAAALPGSDKHWNRLLVTHNNAIVSQILDAMGLEMSRTSSGLVNIDHTLIGPDRTEVHQTTELLLRAEVDGCSGFPVVYQQDSDAPCAPRVEALSGCRVGSMVQCPEHRLVVAELLIPRPLHRGETHLLAYRTHWAATATESYRWERSLGNTHDHHVMTVTFTGTPPRGASHYVLDGPRDDTADPGPELWGTPVPVEGGQVQVAIADAVAGVHGLAWQW